MLIAFRSPSPLAGATELPKRLRVGKWGRNESTKGAFTVNEFTVAALPRMQKALGFEEVMLDFEHNTVPGDDGKPVAEPVKIAARGRPVVIPGEGLFLDNATWTKEGSDVALGGHYPDISPAVKLNERGEVVFLHSAALCRQGSVPDLQLFSAALNAGQLTHFSATPNQPPAKMDYKKLLLIMLGLAETAADTEIESGAKAFAAKFSKTDLGDVSTFNASLKTATEALAALEKKFAKQERDSMTASAIAAGKVIPFSAEIDKLSNEAFAAVLAGLPAGIVPLEQRTPEKIKTFSASTQSAESDVSEAVRVQLGISKEEWVKA